MPDRLITGTSIPNLKKRVYANSEVFQDAGTECVNCGGVHVIDFQDIGTYTKFLSYLNMMCTPNHVNRQSIDDNTRSHGNMYYNLLKICTAGYTDEHRFSQCLPCDKIYSRKLCEFHHAVCFGCDKMGCITSAHFATSSTKTFSSDSTNLGYSNNNTPSLFTNSSLMVLSCFVVEVSCIKSIILVGRFRSLNPHAIIETVGYFRS